MSKLVGDEMSLKETNIWKRWASLLPIKYHNCRFFISETCNLFATPNKLERILKDDKWTNSWWLDQNMVLYFLTDDDGNVFGDHPQEFVIRGSKISGPLLQGIRLIQCWDSQGNHGPGMDVVAL